MKKSMLVLLSVLGLVWSSVTLAAEPLEKSMDAMGKSYRTISKTESLDEFKAALAELRTEAVESRKHTPPKLAKEPADSDKLKDYHHGIDELISGIDRAQQFADAGDLKQAKAETDKLKDIRNEYHKKYK